MWGSVTGKKSSASYYDGLEPKVRFTRAERRKNFYEIKDKREYSSVVSHCESVAILTSQVYLSPTEEGFVLNSESLSDFILAKERAPLGEYESFRDELALAGGTAFFVGDRYMLTAGHCVCIPEKERLPGQDPESLDVARIRNKRVVFGFQKNHAVQSEFKFKEKDVYKIKKVVAHRYNKEIDWALIKLDRPVEGRAPLQLDFTSRIHLHTDLYVLGHPSGLPLKLTEGAKVKAISDQYFYADVDAFQGNSGSPAVIEDRVYGIVVRGPKDDYHVTRNYRNTGRTRVEVRQVNGAFERYNAMQKINQLLFVQHYLLAKSGDLEANYQVALDYNFGEGGVKVHFSKAVKWMQRAARRGHVLARDNLSILPEFNARRVLKLGSKGLSQYKATDACNHIAGVLIGIVTLPLFALPGIHLSVKLTNKLESRFFELLSLDDERFNLFNYIAWGLSSMAEDELDKHRDFYTHIVGTHAFQGRLRTSKPEYVRFFANQGMIPWDFTLSQEYSILDPLIELRDKFCETEL